MVKIKTTHITKYGMDIDGSLIQHKIYARQYNDYDNDNQFNWALALALALNAYKCNLYTFQELLFLFVEYHLYQNYLFL